MRTVWEDALERHAGDYRFVLQPSGFQKEACEQFTSLLTGDEQIVLDVGSGTGSISAAVAQGVKGAYVVATDISQLLLCASAEAVRRGGVPNMGFVAADMFRLPFADDTFSLVISGGVIEHSPDWWEAAREHVRVCMPGGRVAIAVPNWWNLPHTLYKWAYRRKHGVDCEYGMELSFRHAHMRRLGQELGLEGVKVWGFAPMHGISRLQGRRWWLRGARFLAPLSNALDRVSRGLFSAAFGFEIMMVGRKPEA